MAVLEAGAHSRVRSSLLLVLYLGLGAFVFAYTVRELEYNVFPFTVFLTVLGIGLGAEILASNAARKWLWVVAFWASCASLYAIALRSTALLMRHPTPELTHRFALCSVAFFSLVTAWIIFAPVKARLVADPGLQKLQFAMSLAVGGIQLILGVQFLRQVWFAASTEQIRTSMRILVYAGVAAYVFFVTRILLPKITRVLG